MTRERRQNFRLLMTLECAINVDDTGFRRCRTRDISQEGAFVVGNTDGLVPNGQIALTVQIGTKGHTLIRHFRAVVRHLSESGVGLYVQDAKILLQTLLARPTLGNGV